MSNFSGKVLIKATECRTIANNSSLIAGLIKRLVERH